MVKAELKSDGCFYCPECDHRISVRDISHLDLALPSTITVYGICKCPAPSNREWSFKFDLRESSNQ